MGQRDTSSARAIVSEDAEERILNALAQTEARILHAIAMHYVMRRLGPPREEVTNESMQKDADEAFAFLKAYVNCDRGRSVTDPAANDTARSLPSS